MRKVKTQLKTEGLCKAVAAPGRGAHSTGQELPRPVLVLSGRSPQYASLLDYSWVEPIYEPSVESFLARLARQPVSGFVLDLDQVLHAPRPERDHLFQLAGTFPLLRVRCGGQVCGLSCLDDRERFAGLVRVQPPRLARHAPRVPVLLRAVLRRKSRAERPDVSATILDLSVCGGALNCTQGLDCGEELDVRILDLADSSAMPALVCWAGRRGGRVGRVGQAGRPGRLCAGLRFLSMRPEQARELGARYLGGVGSLA